jgi:hypothetical protein
MDPNASRRIAALSALFWHGRFATRPLWVKVDSSKPSPKLADFTGFRALLPSWPLLFGDRTND